LRSNCFFDADDLDLDKMQRALAGEQIDAEDQSKLRRPAHSFRLPAASLKPHLR